MIAVILDVIVFLFLLYAIYYLSRLLKKKPAAPVTTKSVTEDSTVKASVVQPVTEVKSVTQAPAAPTQVQSTQEPKTMTQAPIIAAPAEPAVTEGEVKAKQIESQAIKSNEAPAPAPEPVTQAPAASSVEHHTTTTGRGSKIIDIEGIGPVYAAKLNSIGIYTTSDLLKAGETPLMRRELAEKTGITHNLILRWVNMADLFRIRGVGEEYSDLLEAAGVDTVVELAKRVPQHLHAKMLEVNAEKKLVRRLPALSMVEGWVKEAKTLPRKIEY